MANTGQSVPITGATTGNTAKVAAIVAFIPSFFAMLPQNVALFICAGMVTCAAITAAVPAPAQGRVLVALYQIVRVAGLGVRYAVPYMAVHLTKTVPTQTGAAINPAVSTPQTTASAAVPGAASSVNTP
ncbi:hypothetical protein GOB86_10970 [Acetobacter lambici]|uniref:Uncharacterized protein n=1 Tax=Acetobacter lambici TaxID=1332824 RepID=A0ABT1F0R2_9PROT|nr:hypothetical protein [Acetobacter lambici]MCP1241749.1 hypothetical protein [Acetobacter lambici]MCP1257874.1 hypothetical protein [Acetobacter lambici]NHO57567.1 hypothetical protein [Acetobacter lambici]